MSKLEIRPPSIPKAGPLAEFDAVASTVTEKRGAAYGHPVDDFGRVARMTAVTDECKDPLMRHVLYMLCVKIARLIETPSHLDSLIDIAGYARTGAMLLEGKNEDSA